MSLLILFASGSWCEPSCHAQAWTATSQAERIREWRFGRKDDLNADGWPDGWQRRRDLSHPAYIEVEIAARNDRVARQVARSRGTLVRLLEFLKTGRWDPNFIPETTPTIISDFLDQTILDRCLEIRMDGGAAELISPRLLLDPRFTYQLRADVSTQQLDGHRVWVELRMYDSTGSLISSSQTDSASGTLDWMTLSVDINPDDADHAAWGRLHIKVTSLDSLQITGLARIDNLCLYRTPRLQLTTSSPHNVAPPKQPIEIRCVATGLQQAGQQVLFEIIDLEGRVIDSRRASLQFEPGDHSSPRLEADNRGHYISAGPISDASSGRASWKFQLPQPGLYKIKAHLLANDRGAEVIDTDLAIIEPLDDLKAGPFGWSLPAFGAMIQPSEVPQLVRQFGAGWIKFSAWFEMRDFDLADALVLMTERLQNMGVRCVGRLDAPPASQLKNFGESQGRLYARNLFRQAEIWEPLLEPVLTRMGMRLTWFQLGADDDTSFSSAANSEAALHAIRERMQDYCQQLNLSIGWDWLQPSSQVDLGTDPFQAAHYRTTPQLTAGELRRYLANVPKSGHSVWINLNLLPASQYSLRDRTIDLTERMIECRRHDVQAAFLTRPFDAERGIFDSDRRATAMLIPWRQLVAHLGDAKHIGVMDLPRGSINHVFAREHSGIMVLWNYEPVIEQQYLGNDASAIDIWGSPIQIEHVPLSRGGTEQRLAVDQWPVIVRNLDINVVHLRRDFHLHKTYLASDISSRQTLPASIRNPFPQALIGEITLVCDELIDSGSVKMPVKLPASSLRQLSFPIALRPNASAGDHRVRFDFDVQADQRYRFSIYRQITLGLGDVKFTWEAERVDRNTVELRMKLSNHLDSPVSFDCKLFPPGMPYQRFQILEASPGNTHGAFHLRIPEESSPMECWLRCEGIGLQRTLNYRIQVW